MKTLLLFSSNDSINFYLKKFDLVSAKRIADKEVQKLKQDPYSWFLRGEVYSAISKDREQKIMTHDQAIIEACKCFSKTAILAKKTGKVSSTYIAKLNKCQQELTQNGNTAFKTQEYDKANIFYSESLNTTNVINQINRKIDFDTVTLFNQALVLEKLGNTESAKQNYLKLLSLKYSNPVLYSNLAYIYKGLEQYQNAIKTIEAGLKIYPYEKNLLIDWVNFHIITGKQQEILNDLKQKVQQQKNNANLHFLLASLYDNISFTLDAEAHYKKAIDLDSNYVSAAYNLAVMYYNLAMDKNKILNETDRNSEDFKRIISERNILLKKAEPYFKKAMPLNPEEIERIIKNIRKSIG